MKKALEKASSLLVSSRVIDELLMRVKLGLTVRVTDD
jgi:hypothetical protein